MKTLLVVAVLVVSPVASAQIRISIGVPMPVITVPVVPMPVIRFEVPPPVVEVDPGVQVVSVGEEEVFVADGFYWHRSGGRWFRSHDHRGNWAPVEPHQVPGRIASAPPRSNMRVARQPAIGQHASFSPRPAVAQRPAMAVRQPARPSHAPAGRRR